LPKELPANLLRQKAVQTMLQSQTAEGTQMSDPLDSEEALELDASTMTGLGIQAVAAIIQDDLDGAPAAYELLLAFAKTTGIAVPEEWYPDEPMRVLGVPRLMSGQSSAKSKKAASQASAESPKHYLRAE
jgi:hypothetical protein